MTRIYFESILNIFRIKKIHLGCIFLIIFFIFGFVVVHQFLQNNLERNVQNSPVKINNVGRMLIVEMPLTINNNDEAVEVRVVVSEEKVFRLDKYLIDYFSDEMIAKKDSPNVYWQREVAANRKLDSYIGKFQTDDGAYGVIINRLHSYRIYRKYKNRYEVDYSFDADSFNKDVMAHLIVEIDRNIINKLVDFGVFK